MKKTIWIMRHAENHKDESLGLGVTEEGKRKTADLARKIAAADNNAPTLILCSSSQRGRDTAEILREEFSLAAKESIAVQNDRLASLRDQDLVNLMSVIANLDEACAAHDLPRSNSLIMIMHKQNMLLPIFSSFLDAASFAAGRPVSDEERFSLSDVSAAAALDDDAMMAQLGFQDNELETPNYLDAMQYELREDRWDSLGFGCARFVQKLEIF